MTSVVLMLLHCFLLAMLAGPASGQLQNLPKCGVSISQNLSAGPNPFIVCIADTLNLTAGLYRQCRPQLNLCPDRHALYLRRCDPPGPVTTMCYCLMHCSRAIEYDHHLLALFIVHNPGVNIVSDVSARVATLNITNAQCGIFSGHDQSWMPPMIFFIVLAGILFILRLVSRVVCHTKLWWDDFFNLLAAVSSLLKR